MNRIGTERIFRGEGWSSGSYGSRELGHLKLSSRRRWNAKYDCSSPTVGQPVGSRRIMAQNEPKTMHGQDTFAYGMWPVVAFNILLVVFFALSFIKPHRPIGANACRRPKTFLAIRLPQSTKNARFLWHYRQTHAHIRTG